MIYVKPKRYKKLSGKYFYRRCSEISSLKEIWVYDQLQKANWKKVKFLSILLE